MSSRQPQARVQHAAIGVGKKLYIWGGFSGHGNIQTMTVESFDISSESWQQPMSFKLFQGQQLPDNLYATAITNACESVYFFGGVTGPNDTGFTKMYHVNLSTLECRELESKNPSDAPEDLKGSRMVLFNGKLVHSGSAELHVYDFKTSELAVDYAPINVVYHHPSLRGIGYSGDLTAPGMEFPSIGAMYQANSPHVIICICCNNDSVI